MSLLAMHGQMLRSGGLWTPADMSAPPKIWCDWESPITNAGGYASAWGNDKGTIGGAFVQSTSGARPEILEGEVGGKRVLRFDGSNDGMVMQSEGAGNIFRAIGFGWCFMVLRKRIADASATRVALYAPAFNDASRLSIGLGFTSPNQNASYVSSRRQDSGSTVTNFGSNTPVGAWSFRRVEANWGANALADYVDESLSISAALADSSGSTSNSAGRDNQLRIGADRGFFPADMDLAALLIGSGSYLSSGELSRVAGWAAWQLGLEATLPVGHPYRSGPPMK